jgi:hypothetical protein
MYKILVIVMTLAGHASGGVSTAMETISFDNYAAAQAAYENLIKMCVPGMTVIALY